MGHDLCNLIVDRDMSIVKNIINVILAINYSLVIKYMTSITAIPLDDVKNFLMSYNQSVPQTINEIYLAAWNLLRSNKIQSIPSSIADWFIAYDLSIQRIQIPSYKSTDILFSTDEKLYIFLSLDKTIEKNRPVDI